MIVWIAPWVAIFLVDWCDAPLPLRAERAAADRHGRVAVLAHGGIYWPAIIAQVVGMFAAISALSATFHLPRWLNEVTYHTADATASAPTSASSWAWASAAVSILVLATRSVRPQADEQDQRLAEAAGPASRRVGRWSPGPWATAALDLDRVSSYAATPGRRAVEPHPSPRPGPRRRRGGTAAWRRGCGPRAASSPSDALASRRPRSRGSRPRPARPPTRRTRRSAAVVDAPVEMTSSTTATRRPRTASTRARSKSSRWRLSVVMERTGSAIASPRWILGVLCRIT